MIVNRLRTPRSPAGILCGGRPEAGWRPSPWWQKPWL